MDNFEAKLICCRASEIGPAQVDQWRDLYDDSLSPNIYMSPDFVLTALGTICSDDPIVICITVNDRLFGLGILQENRRSLNFPLRSTKLFKTIHSFQSGILFRKGITDEVVDTFLSELILRGQSYVSFVDFAMTTTTAKKVIASAKRLDFHWYELRRYSRPTLTLCMPIEEWKATRKKIVSEADRQRRRLTKQGRLSWRIVMPAEVTDETLETFLSLEHDGWKGDEGTSLLSRNQETSFFRQLVPRLVITGEIFFTELRLNDGTIASTVNFMSGSVAFAYKVAWSKRFASFGPGILNEISFIEFVASNTLPFAYIESGTSGESFIQRLWPDRISMFTGYLIGGPFAKCIASALRTTRRFGKALLKGPTQRKNI